MRRIENHSDVQYKRRARESQYPASHCRMSYQDPFEWIVRRHPQEAFRRLSPITSEHLTSHCVLCIVVTPKIPSNVSQNASSTRNVLLCCLRRKCRISHKVMCDSLNIVCWTKKNMVSHVLTDTRPVSNHVNSGASESRCRPNTPETINI